MTENFDLYRPFGPPIGKFKFPLKIVNKINKFVDETIKDKKKSNILDVGSGLAGQVSQELALPKEMVEGELVKLFSSFTTSYISQTLGVKIKNFKLIQCWVVRQFKNEYNPIHWHTGHVSGAGWLKIPDNFGQTAKNKKNNPNGKINFIHGSKQFLSNPRTEINPIVGDMCIFPHYLMHEVYPFNAEGERRSISFNAFIDDEIFNTSQLKSA